MRLKELVNKCIKGDINAQRELYDIYSPKMLSICHRYAKSLDDAKDIFQEGFLKIYENLHQLNNPEYIEWWMKKIFINEAYKLYNKRKILKPLKQLNSFDWMLRDSFNIYSKIETDEITSIIQRLPHKMQLVFNMYVIEGFSHKEIAKLLEISVGTSKSNLHDARNFIRKEINKLERSRIMEKNG